MLLNAEWDHTDYYTSEQSIHDTFAGIIDRTKSTIFAPDYLCSDFTAPANASLIALPPLNFIRLIRQKCAKQMKVMQRHFSSSKLYVIQVT